MHVLDNVEDFSRYMAGSYIKLLSNPKAIYYVPDATYAGGGNLILQKLNSKGGTEDPETFKFKDVLELFDFSCPEVGNINTDFGYWYLELIPARQYRKGFCWRRVEVLNIGTEHDRKHRNVYIHEIFNPHYFKTSEILHKLKKGERIAGALNRNLGIGLVPLVVHPMIYYKDIPIGEVKGEVFEIHPKFKAYKGYVETTVDPYKVKIKP